VNEKAAPRNDGPRDERAERRDRRRQAERERMKKHGARTAEVYRNAILKRLRKKAGKK
jgi:hypothetical protein